LTEARHALPFVRALAGTLGLAVAVFLTAPPLVAAAQPAYNVASDQDFPKLPASGAECRSTQEPNHPCTLRAAIDTVNAAATGATINVPGNFAIQLDPALSELGVNVAMSITSVGGGSAIVDGALQTRVFHIMSGVTAVTMSGLTVRHGKVTGNLDKPAGGILNDGTLTLNNVVVTQNEAPNVGGIGDTGTLTMNGGAVAGNTATGKPGGPDPSVAGGLAVASGGVVAVTATSFVNNRADFGGGIVTFGTLTLANVTLANNSTRGGGGGLLAGDPESSFGAADVNVTNSVIKANTTSGLGAGILLGAGRLVVNGSTMSHNNASAGSGGGLFVVKGSATLTNDTLSGNAAALGGGIAKGAFSVPRAGTGGGPATALADQVKPVRDRVGKNSLSTRSANERGERAGSNARPDDITLGWVTLAGNSAQTGGGISNGADLSFTAHDTIVAANTAAAGANCSGSVSSGGHNLESARDCDFKATGDRSSSQPRLGALADNGGPTQTMSLQTGSAAIDAGGRCPPPASDQRGVSRPQGAACDIGAFEAPPAVPAPPSTGR
jgi:hypothetical protein